MRSRRAVAVAAGLALLTVAAFRGLRDNDFLSYDDPRCVSRNPAVAAGLTPRSVLWALTSFEQANWYPVTRLSHLLDVRLFGMDPGAHHLASLALHTVNALLLLHLLRALTGALWRPAIVAALFAVHPQHVESVAWAAERSDVLAALFALAAAIAYQRAARRERVRGAVALPALFALALMAKPTPVTLPFLLLLLDWWPLGRWSPTPGAPPGAALPFARLLPPPRLWLEKAPLFLLTAASSLVTFRAQALSGAVVSPGDLPLADRLANAVHGLAAYVVKTLWPVDLAVFYPYPMVPRPLLETAGALLLLAALTLLAWRWFRSRPFVAVGWLWYLGTLVPVIGIAQAGEQARADRFTYLPLAGLFVAAAWALAGVRARRPGRIAAAAAGALLAVAACAVLTGRQVGRWRDDRTLFTHAAAVTEGNWVAQGILAADRRRAGDDRGAAEFYRRAVELRPVEAQFLEGLGSSLVALGRHAEAEPYLRRALLVNPANPFAQYGLGQVFHARGALDDAARHYREALRRRERFLPARVALGLTFADRGRYGAAADEFRRALAVDPDHADARFNLALSLARSGDDAGAVAQYRALLRDHPRDAEALSRLGESLARLGRAGEPP